MFCFEFKLAHEGDFLDFEAFDNQNFGVFGVKHHYVITFFDGKFKCFNLYKKFIYGDFWGLYGKIGFYNYISIRKIEVHFISHKKSMCSIDGHVRMYALKNLLDKIYISMLYYVIQKGLYMANFGIIGKFFKSFCITYISLPFGGFNMTDDEIRWGLDNLKGDIADLSKIVVRTVETSAHDELSTKHVVLDYHNKMVLDFLRKKDKTYKKVVAVLLGGGLKRFFSEFNVSSLLFDIYIGLQVETGLYFVPVSPSFSGDVRFMLRISPQLAEIIENIVIPTKFTHSFVYNFLMWEGLKGYNDFSKEIEKKFPGYGHKKDLEIPENIINESESKYNFYKKYFDYSINRVSKMLEAYYRQNKDYLKEKVPDIYEWCRKYWGD